jgi:flavin reductase (DIM6/NTAB) family NADH-FMN oxidoreductase RutF
MTRISPDEFRKALGRWPSGVTVVTVGDGARIHGLTVSAFSSVSLDPPIVLVCIGLSSRVHPYLEAKPAFVVNVLSAGQSEISNGFAKPTADRSRFDGISFHWGTTGCPVLDDTAASLECTVETAVTAGDHVTYFGRVVHTECSARDPLIYHAGGYREILYGRRKRAR